ncbi:hypothetical protein J2S11_004151 [Bacillus horti]|uniref:Uncharacterized protein n=1 Tax=Caldalkalibacillus horti TaxID=77523 RepID=A0ABT9W559_9BACI|nr:hypothetical protein [Bacillus horti]
MKYQNILFYFASSYRSSLNISFKEVLPMTNLECLQLETKGITLLSNELGVSISWNQISA